MKRRKGPLNEKERRFVLEYVKDLSSGQAALRAGYKNGKMGSDLLADPRVADAVNIELEKHRKDMTVSVQRVIKELARIGYTDIRDLFDDNGRLLPVKQLPEDVARAVSSIKVVTNRIPGTDPVEVEHTVEVKFWDKKGGLELLGRYLKMYTDKLELTGNVALAERLKRARERTGK